MVMNSGLALTQRLCYGLSQPMQTDRNFLPFSVLAHPCPGPYPMGQTPVAPAVNTSTRWPERGFRRAKSARLLRGAVTGWRAA